jgi:hypothetical protein
MRTTIDIVGLAMIVARDLIAQTTNPIPSCPGVSI